MAANSANGLVYNRAAQTQRVSIHRVSDKRGLEMLAVRPLIRQSYILNRSLCLKRGRLYGSQRKLKVESWSLDEPQKPTPFPTVRPVRTPKSDAPISKSTPCHAAGRKHWGVDRKKGRLSSRQWNFHLLFAT